MSIRRATPDIEVKIGDFIIGNSFITYHICGHAGKVTNISGKRIYYDRIIPGEEYIDSTYMNRDQVRFVCDTREEVDTLDSLSKERYRDTSANVRELEGRMASTSDALLTALIEASA